MKLSSLNPRSSARTKSTLGEAKDELNDSKEGNNIVHDVRVNASLHRAEGGLAWKEDMSFNVYKSETCIS